MSTPVTTYPKGYIGATFKQKIIDDTDPQNPVTLDLTDNNGVYVIFVKPDGTVFPTQAEIDENPDDNTSIPISYRADIDPPNPLTESFVRVQNLTGPSLLDVKGPWEYYAAARFTDGRFIINDKREIFWVT